MNIFMAETGDQIPGDLLLESINRTDLAPIPRTLEFTVRLKDDLETRLAEGNKVWAGFEHLPYKIVKRQRAAPAGVIQGDSPLQAMQFTAFLDSCSLIGEPRKRAVIANNATLGSLYRACGAQVVIADDFTVDRFACLVGDVPSKSIAVALQEEGAALVLNDKKLYIKRLADLMAQAPVDTVGQFDSSAALDSELMERHEVPMCFSIGSDGAAVDGNYTKSRRMRYLPGKGERVLRNMSRVLVTRRIVDSQLAQQILAGDVITVAGANYVVITAAHRFRRSNDGRTDTASRFWVGEVSA